MSQPLKRMDEDELGSTLVVPSLEGLLNPGSLEEHNTHLLFGYIDEHTAEETCRFLLSHHFEKKEGDSNLIINSFGGYCNDGFAIIDSMRMVRQDVVTLGLGKIMSMGFMIFINGTKGKRYLSEHCSVMCHQHLTGAPEVKYYEFMNRAEEEKKYYKLVVQNIVANSNLDKKQVEDILLSAHDAYLTPKECVKYGLADGILKSMF